MPNKKYPPALTKMKVWNNELPSIVEMGMIKRGKWEIRIMAEWEGTFGYKLHSKYLHSEEGFVARLGLPTTREAYDRAIEFINAFTKVRKIEKGEDWTLRNAVIFSMSNCVI